MGPLLLTLHGLVAVQAGHAAVRVRRHLELVNDRGRLVSVRLGAFSRCPDKAGCRLSANTTGLKWRAGVIHNKRSYDEGRAHKDRDEKRLERHGAVRALLAQDY